MLARLRELNWKTLGERNAPIWEEDFAFHIFNMAQNNNTEKIYLRPELQIQSFNG